MKKCLQPRGFKPTASIESHCHVQAVLQSVLCCSAGLRRPTHRDSRGHAEFPLQGTSPKNTGFTANLCLGSMALCSCSATSRPVHNITLRMPNDSSLGNCGTALEEVFWPDSQSQLQGGAVETIFCEGCGRAASLCLDSDWGCDFLAGCSKWFKTCWERTAFEGVAIRHPPIT